jgi:SAM-dependent methyltransferase
MQFRRQADMGDAKLVQFLQDYDQIVQARIAPHYPQFKYPLRMRDWELYQVFSRLPVDNCDIRIMDTGAYSTYTALFLDAISDHVVVSDHFGWTRRPEYTSQPIITPRDDWENVIRTCTPRVEIRHVDLTDIPYDDDTFDYITCVSTIEHTAKPRRALEEMVRCTKPGGRVLITTDHNPRGTRFDGNDRFLSLRQLQKLFQGFTDLSPDMPPDYARENWCYDRPDLCILILFVEVEKSREGMICPSAKTWWQRWWSTN